MATGDKGRIIEEYYMIRVEDIPYKVGELYVVKQKWRKLQTKNGENCISKMILQTTPIHIRERKSGLNPMLKRFRNP